MIGQHWNNSIFHNNDSDYPFFILTVIIIENPLLASLPIVLEIGEGHTVPNS